MNVTADNAKISTETFDEFLVAQGDLEFCEAAAIAEIARDRDLTPPPAPHSAHPEPVEGLSLLFEVACGARSKVQPFDKLRVDGFWGATPSPSGEGQ